MANSYINNLNELSASQAAVYDLAVVVDVNSNASLTGETKKMTFGDLSEFLLAQHPYVNEENLSINDVPKYPLSASHGGTGLISLPLGVLTGNGTSSLIIISGSNDQYLGYFGTINFYSGSYITSSGTSSYTASFTSSAVTYSLQYSHSAHTSSADYNFPDIQNIPTFFSESSQLPSLISSSHQVSFNLLSDVQHNYISENVVVVNNNGTGLTYVTSSLFTNDDTYKKASAAGVYYFNGDIREKLYSNTNPSSLFSGTDASIYAQNFLHSTNLFLNKNLRQIYFTRGCYPRRRGVDVNDYKGWTWREMNNTTSSQAEAVCRSREDGYEFITLANLYTSNIGNSLTNSTQDSFGTFVVSEPVAVVYHEPTEKIFVACRNDHNSSIIYRMDATGSQSDIENSWEVWVELIDGTLKIDCLELGTIPQSFYSASNPSVNTDYLFVGISPDWNKNTNIDVNSNAAIFKFPVTGSPIGKLNNFYPSAYTLHRWWGSCYNTEFPDMGKSGIKSLKLFVARLDDEASAWDSTIDPSLVDKSNSRLYTVHSGAPSRDAIYTASSVPVGTYQVNYPTGSAVTASVFYDNNQFGGHGVFELLIGEVPDNNISGSFDGTKDFNRPYKTWRLGILETVNGNQTGLNIGYDDPGYPTNNTGSSGIGTARGTNFQVHDRLFISTSPNQIEDFNGITYVGPSGCRGTCEITTASCDLYTARYILKNGDGQTGLGFVMAIPVLMNSVNNFCQSPITMGQQGLQQMTIDPVEGKFYVSDFYASNYYATFSGYTPSPVSSSYTVKFSEFGTIYQGNLWQYSRGINGQRLFDDANPQIGYSKPCGLTSYNEGPVSASRLIYTNGENNFQLSSSLLTGGNTVNGFSRTFTQDNVLAQGFNVLSISDIGPTYDAGIIVNFSQSTTTSDYLVYAYNDLGGKFGSGQLHDYDIGYYSGSIITSSILQNAAYYFGKNRNQFRITYNGAQFASQSMNVLYFSVFGGNYDNLIF